ncbi:Uncharacterised protein [Chryseobacterium taihuense]|uniref:Uncharacterized protein n=1 Tax=Chryseobacterium taihuense TaxID=1141221 RepID=A0A4U8WBL0_9FLAO|nr:Uncharacterised protein [Chryseobacterium taihuense]
MIYGEKLRINLFNNSDIKLSVPMRKTDMNLYRFRK